MHVVREWLVHLLQSAPEIALFLSLGLGYIVGKMKFGSFTLGGTAGSLLIGILIGIAAPGIVVGDVVKAIFFALFIYAVGFRTGPQFFQGFNKSMISQVVLTVVVTVAGLICVLIASKMMNLKAGMAAGLGAGSLTESAIIGTAGDALKRLGLSAEEVKKQQDDIAIGYAVTYLFGTIGIIFFARDIAPRLLGINLKQASAEYETRLAGGKAPLKAGQFRVNTLRGIRAFRAAAGVGVGKTVRQLEESLAGRCFVQRVRRGEKDVPVTPDLAIGEGDVVLLAGTMEGLLQGNETIGEEVACEGFDIVAEALDVVVTRKEIIGKTIADLDNEDARGVFLRGVVRGGSEMPLNMGFKLERGDTLMLTGSAQDIQRVGKKIGSIERPSDKTDLLYCGIGIVVGTLLGMLAVRVGGVPITLGAGGGVLVAGLVFGWLRSMHPTFGNFPGPVQTVFSDLGLNAFIAVVGLSAGPKAWDALKETGVGLLLAGFFATIVPPFIGLYVGKMMKMEPVVLVGAICGARSANAAIAAVNDEAGSSAPAIGFTVPYAIANVLLTVWGPVIVGIIH